MKILELFGGIGACSKAFKRLGIDIEIADYVEIDKYAVKSYNAINGTNFEPQDITKWDKDIEVDFIMHGSPCQDFSVAGLNKGGDKDSGTRSSLMYETIRIVEKLKPKYVLWENVKNLLSKKHIHNFKNYISIMNELGYNSYYQVLNSKNYGIPQNRERVFTLSIRQDIDNGTFVFPKPFELKLKLKDMLEQDVDEKYYLSDKMSYSSSRIKEWEKRNVEINNMSPTLDTRSDCLGIVVKQSCEQPLNNNFMFNYYNNRQITDIAPTQTTNCGNYNSSASVLISNKEILIKNNTKLGYQVAVRGDGIDLENQNSNTRRGRVQKQMIQTLNTQDNKGVVLNDLRIRKLTPKECWRLMGFDDTDFEKAEKVNSNAQLYKQAGNSIVVNVLERILENLFLKEENDFEGQMNFNMLGDQ